MDHPVQTTYFVTGASGFIGSHVCELLRERGHRVKGLTRRSAQTLARLGVELVWGDISDPADWAANLGDVDIVIHCAGNARFGNGPVYVADNVLATAKMIEVARASAPRLKRLIFISTVGVLDRAASDSCSRPLDESSPLYPSSDYGQSKAAAETLVMSSGLPFVILRPALVVGSAMRADSHFSVFARWALRRHPLSRIAWTGCFSVVAVEDLAAAVLLCATHPDAPGRIFMCGGHPIELGDFFNRITPASRFPLRAFKSLSKLLAFAMPFKLKCMVLPALLVNDSALKRLGWCAHKMPEEALDSLIMRERARLDPLLEPRAGQTVITGAASGLGRALAQRLASHRPHLLLIDRDGPGLADLLLQIPHARCLSENLADETRWESLVNSPEWTAQPIAELYACAGFGRRGEFEKDNVEAQLDMLRVNLLARMRLTHAVIPDMARAHFGRIVLIASSSAFQPLPLMAAYAASNAGLLFFGEGLAYELENQGIHVMTVCPGGMRTAFQKTAGVRENPSEKLMAPGAAVDRIMRGLTLQKTTLVFTGRALAMALLARFIPRTLSLRLWGRLMAALR